MGKLIYNGSLDITIEADFSKESVEIENNGKGTITIKQIKVNLYDTGSFHQSLKGKTIHTKINKAGGRVVVGISDE